MQTTSSREVYRNPWFSVREDAVTWPDGTEGLYGVLDKPDFAMVVPVDADGQLWLVRQYRYPLRGLSWEFPSGSWPAGSHGTSRELAAAELREETGLSAGAWRQLGRLHTTPGISSQAFAVYLATDLTPGPTDREATEQGMEHLAFTPTGVESMIRSGAIACGHTVAAYGLWLLNR